MNGSRTFASRVKAAAARRAAPLTGVVVLAFFLTGCVHAPLPTGYLADYSALSPQPPPCATVYAERSAAGREPRVDHMLLVLPSRWDAKRLANPSRETELLEFLDRRLYIQLLRVMPSSVIVTQNRDVDDFVEAGANVTTLRLSITDYKRGIGIVRMLIGFHLGAAQLQIEGRLADLATGKVIAVFARRGFHDGVVMGLPTPQSLSAWYCWKLSIDETTRLLARYIAGQLTPPPPRWWDALDTGPPPGSLREEMP